MANKRTNRNATSDGICSNKWSMMCHPPSAAAAREALLSAQLLPLPGTGSRRTDWDARSARLDCASPKRHWQRARISAESTRLFACRVRARLLRSAVRPSYLFAPRSGERERARGEACAIIRWRAEPVPLLHVHRARTRRRTQCELVFFAAAPQYGDSAIRR